MSALAARVRHWWSNPVPAGYRPGSLITRLRHDLRDLACHPLNNTCVRFSVADGPLEFQAQERVEAQFLMHVVSTEFSCRVPYNTSGRRQLIIRHSGSWKRTGITCSAPRGSGTEAQALANRLSSDADLAAAMVPLDFTRCELNEDALGWEIRMAHFGACEVVYRVPAIRQYVRLSSGQRAALIASFALLGTLLRSEQKESLVSGED